MDEAKSIMVPLENQKFRVVPNKKANFTRVPNGISQIVYYYLRTLYTYPLNNCIFLCHGLDKCQKNPSLKGSIWCRIC